MADLFIPASSWTRSWPPALLPFGKTTSTRIVPFPRSCAQAGTVSSNYRPVYDILVRPAGAVFVSTINRNLKSFLLAIVAAEYLLKLIPRGTHEYERLIRPAELARWARAAGLRVNEIAGLDFSPLTQTVRLTRDPAVNYIAHLGS